MDLMDSDVEEVQRVRSPQRRRARLRKSLGSPRSAAGGADHGDNNAASDSDAGAKEEAGPSRTPSRRRRSTRAAAAKASRRLSLVVAELEDSSGQEQEPGPDSGDAFDAFSRGTAESNSDDGQSDEASDELPAQRAAACSGRRGSTPGRTRSRRRGSRAGAFDTAGHDAASSQSDDEADAAQAQQAATPSRLRSRRRGSHAGADRVAAAGEAFRRRLAGKKPPADEAVLAEARRQSLQDAVAASNSDYESPPERSPPIQDFIVDGDESDEEEPDGGDAGAGPHFRFEVDDGLPGMPSEEEAQPRRKRKKRRNPENSTASGKRRRQRERQQDEAWPSDTAQADGIGDGGAAAQQPIELSSDDGDPQPARASHQQRRRRHGTRHANGDSNGPDAAGPSGLAAQPEDEADAAAADAEAAGAQRNSARKRRLARVISDEDTLERTPPCQTRAGGGPFERQRTLHDFLSPRQQPGNELEDEDAPTPRAPSEDGGSSLEDFIEPDDEEDCEELSDDEDPVPAALEELRRSLGDNDRDVALARAFADLVCGLLHHFMGAEMDRQLTTIYENALWRIMTMVETAGHEVSNQLGWVNAERNGVIDAIRKFTCFSTGHAFFGSGVTSDHDTVDERDGRFTCQVCGRSTGGLASVTLSRPCRADAESLHLHSRSPSKKRPLRRRPPSDDEADGPASGSSRRRRRKQEGDTGSGGDSDADEPKRFWVGCDCVQRVMLATLLRHWTCLFADKLQRVSRHAIQRAQLVADKKQLIADEMARRERFFGFWCRHLRQALGLAKKLGTKPGRAAFGHAPVPNSRFTSVGAEAIHLRNEFDQ